MKFFIVLAALCAVAYGASYGRDSQSEEANYNFAWAVDDKESYVHTSHKESRKGDDTNGEYTIVEPDGSLRKVTYYVNGDSGFIAYVNGVRWPQEAGSSGKYNAGGDSKSSEEVVRYAKPAPKPVVYVPKPAPTPKPYRPAPTPAPKYVARPRARSSSEESGAASVRIETPSHKVAY